MDKLKRGEGGPPPSMKRAGRFPAWRRHFFPVIAGRIRIRMRRKGPPAAAVTLATALFAAAFIVALWGCGGESRTLSEEERVVEQALRSAFAGEGESFLRLVDPSFVERAREEMPDADDETLGGVLLSGFLRDIPYGGLVDPVYQVEVEGEKAVVHVWGAFVDGEGRGEAVAEENAIRVPLRREGARWYLDLLDL